MFTVKEACSTFCYYHKKKKKKRKNTTKRWWYFSRNCYHLNGDEGTEEEEEFWSINLCWNASKTEGCSHAVWVFFHDMEFICVNVKGFLSKKGKFSSLGTLNINISKSDTLMYNLTSLKISDEGYDSYYALNPKGP